MAKNIEAAENTLFAMANKTNSGFIKGHRNHSISKRYTHKTQKQRTSTIK